MTIATGKIDIATLAQLVVGGAVRRTDVIGQAGGWKIVVHYGATASELVAQRGDVRIFRKLDTLASFLNEIGIAHFTVNAVAYDPKEQVRSRPDAAERMKKTHEAAARADRDLAVSA